MVKNTNPLNVFDMYEANGNRVGFWIRRDTWGNTVARVISVAGAASGPLPKKEGARYPDGRPKVIAEFYDVRTWEQMNESEVSSPGTFAYSLVPLASLPEWARK